MKTITIAVMLFIVLSLPVTIVDGYRGEGKMNGSGSGSGQRYGGSEDRPIGGGSTQRFGSDRPDMGILDKEGNGISMMIGSIRYTIDGITRGIDSTNTSWTLKATGPDDNFTKEYSLNASLGGKEMSRIIFRYQVRWQGDEGFVRYNLSIDPLPENGTLRLRYDFHLQGEDLGSFQGEGKRMMIRGQDGSLLGSLDHTDCVSCGNDSEDLSVEWDADSSNATMFAVAQIDGRSVEIGGTITILEKFMATLGGIAEGAIDYVLDHIVSFFIGTACAIVIGIAILAFVGKRKSRPENGLDLRNNRYYKD
jgi:hypothetical protein